jgi:type I restriction-modification system DNA methylase subunit
MTLDFLATRMWRPWSPDHDYFEIEGFDLGNGSNQLEIVLAHSEGRPRKDEMRRIWKDRRGGRPNPVLVVTTYDTDSVALCGPSGDSPPVYHDVDVGVAERIVDVALEKPDRFAAHRFLGEVLDQITDDLVGLRNQGLLSTHELRVGVPHRQDWDDAATKADNALGADDGRELVEELGYEIEPLQGGGYVLRDGAKKTAVAVFLEDDEAFEQTKDRFSGKSAVSYSLNKADNENLQYVVASSGTTLRLYTTDADAGFGSRGRTDTFVELNPDLLTDDMAGYLWLLFSAEALRDGGSLEEIMARSEDYAADLGERLRERIYDDVVPQLAEAIAESRDLDDPTKEELDQTYRMALVLLYRLLFISYAEDEDFLPRRRNGNYREHSLKNLAKRIDRTLTDNEQEFDDDATDYWDEVMQLTKYIHNGHAEWGLPEYDGTLLSSNMDMSEAGAELAKIELTNAEFGPALGSLLIDETPDERKGPIDFRNIGVREFGVIYEGLLESELSVADDDLTLDDGNYRPAIDDETVDVEEREIYLHGQSGERKSTGSYYTGSEFVEHLLDYSLKPALDDHIDKLKGMSDNKAAEHFFDIRVADIAMGSGHFLVGAIDRIESRLSGFLEQRDSKLPRVQQELDRLEQAAMDAFENEDNAPEIERDQLLRRQVARRCIYGVDLNDEATLLARLSLWIHTFVPGLPLTFLDYNLQTGDSIVGIGSLNEITDLADVKQSSLGMFLDDGDDEANLPDIEEEVEMIGQMADSDASEVQQARQTRNKIDERLEQTEAALDILVGSYLDDDVETSVVTMDCDLTGVSSYDKAQEALGDLDVLHFPTTFPEVFTGEDPGFDVIVGNPPWDKVLHEPQQFWVTRFPGLNALSKSKREDRIEELREKYPQIADEEDEVQANRELYQDYVTAAYDEQGHGHKDYSKLFVERALNLQKSSGKLGYVLPRQSLVLGGWKKLRQRLLDESHLTVLQARNRGGWIFEDVHHSYMVVFLTQNSETNNSGAHIWPATKSKTALEKISIDNGLDLSYDEVVNLTTESHVVLPWLNDERATDIFPQMENESRLSDDNGWISGIHDSRWDFRGSGRHGHLTKDSYEENLWKTFMTRNVDQYGINEDKEFRRYVDPEDVAKIGNGVEETDDGEVVLTPDHPTVVFRHPSRNDDTRTMIATAMPQSGYIHTAGYIHGVDDEAGTSASSRMALLAYLNSFTCDWWSRRIVDRHVTAPVINNLPIPDWDNNQIQRANELAVELTRRNGIETIPGGKLPDGDDGDSDRDNKEIRAEIEGLVARGFGLSSDHIDTILDDFSENACPDDLAENIRNELTTDVEGTDE